MNVVAISLAGVLTFFAAGPQGAKTKVEPGIAKAPPVVTTDGAGAMDPPRKVAEAYLKALEGKGDDAARNYLLGGATLTANDFAIPNWKIIRRDAARIEEKDVDGAIKMMRDLEKKGAEALNSVVISEDSSMSLNQEQAHKLLEPTRIQAQKFIEQYPLFSYVARVGKDVFWHPENPWLKEIKKLDRGATYKLELHRFQIEEKDSSGDMRVWPLRVLRATTKNYDSGWKILPASDWDPNY
jgi:hypothetical protein